MFIAIKKLIRSFLCLLRPFVLAASKFTAIYLGLSGDEKDAPKLFSKHGFYLLRKHYYLPIPDESEVSALAR
jgi:hypothetical protein